MPRTMRRLLAASLLSTFLAANTAFAQGANVPVLPAVDDPMLAPVPRAKVEISTWEQALTHVRALSTDLRIAASQVQRAEAQQRVALAGALPSLNGTAAFTHQLITKENVQAVGLGPGGITDIQYKTFKTPPSDYLTGQLVATQPVLALRAWYGIGTARVASDAARLSFDDAKRLIALSVANAIVGVVTAERIAELNRVGLSNALSRLELTVRKTALGGATGLDVVRARQDVEIARATLVAGDETLRQSREALGLALGIPEQVGVPPTVDISGLEHDARTTCKPSATVDARPDVAALRTRVEVAHRGVNDVKYQFAPLVNLQSGLATTTTDTGSSPNTTWNVQAVLSVPLWEGGARYGLLRDARAQEDIAAQNLEAGRRNAVIQVVQARRGVTVAEDRRRVAGAARDLAVETDRLVRLAYQEGRGTSLELITAAQSLRESETQLALRDFELVQSRVLAVLALASCPW
ncbi:MAG: Heavy metal efflux outer membrane protein CzcC family [Labilithrix sp.]|nr:Heavy metal efflux outer membrane protein CzcC family [Labilithrix sp.]